MDQKRQSDSTFDALVKRIDVKTPKAEDLLEFRRLLDNLPAGYALVDLTQHAFNALMEPMAGGRHSAKESLDRERRKKQDELGYGSASGLEKLLIEAVVLSWMRYLDIERRYSNATGESITLNQGDYWERRLTLAQRRYLRAVETLVRVRRLALPALQVNIAAQQVNHSSVVF